MSEDKPIGYQTDSIQTLKESLRVLFWKKKSWVNRNIKMFKEQRLAKFDYLIYRL